MSRIPAPTAPAASPNDIYKIDRGGGVIESSAISYVTLRPNGDWTAGLNTSCGAEQTTSSNFLGGLSKGHWYPAAWVWCSTYHMYRPANMQYDTAKSKWVRSVKRNTRAA